MQSVDILERCATQRHHGEGSAFDELSATYRSTLLPEAEMAMVAPKEVAEKGRQLLEFFVHITSHPLTVDELRARTADLQRDLLAAMRESLMGDAPAPTSGG